MWHAYLEHWYLWTMIPSWPLTALLYCGLATAPDKPGEPNKILKADDILLCTFLALVSQIAWVGVWGIVVLVVVVGLWIELVQWIFSPSKKDAEEIAEKETNRILRLFKQGQQ